LTRRNYIGCAFAGVEYDEEDAEFEAEMPDMFRRGAPRLAAVDGCRAKWADDVLLLDTMWENYSLTGSTEMLVAYIRAGGSLNPLNDELREIAVPMSSWHSCKVRPNYIIDSSSVGCWIDKKCTIR
jgi:hypothetical protein